MGKGGWAEYSLIGGSWERSFPLCVKDIRHPLGFVKLSMPFIIKIVQKKNQCCKILYYCTVQIHMKNQSMGPYENATWISITHPTNSAFRNCFLSIFSYHFTQ